MTRNDIIAFALRTIGVTAHDDSMTADQLVIGVQVADAVYASLVREIGTVTWTMDAVPVSATVPMAQLLAIDLAPVFSKAPPYARGAAWQRLMNELRAYDGSDVEAEYY